MVSWPQSRMGTSGQQEHVIYKSRHCVLAKNQRERECRKKSGTPFPSDWPLPTRAPPDFCHLPLTPSHSRSTKGLMNFSGHSQSHHLWGHLHRYTQGYVSLNIWEFLFKNHVHTSISVWGYADSQKGHIPRNHSYRPLWPPQYGCWESNCNPLQDQQIPLIPEPFLQFLPEHVLVQFNWQSLLIIIICLSKSPFSWNLRQTYSLKL